MTFSTKKPIFLWIFLLMYLSAVSQQESVQGSWGDPIQFGIVPVAVANLPDGRLLTWSSQFRNTFVEAGDGATFSQYFDPFANGGLGGVDGPEFTINTDHDMFCPGINNLPDGRILSAGGTSSERTSIFDPQTGLWSVASEMNIPRGYQGNVTMRDGNVFTVGGSWNDYNSNNPNDPLRNGGKDAEVWSPTTGWITLGNITGEDIYTANDLAQENQGLYRVDNHVWLWPAPNGKLFHAGPGEMMHWIDPEVPGGEILEAGIRRDLGAGQTDGYSMKGNTVMFDAGKILKTGGAPAYGDDNVIQVPARNNSFVIDLNGVAYGAAPPVEYTGNMANLRTMHNSTVLPNGEVLVTGGLEGAAVFTDQTAVYPAEIFNEQTGWRTVAAMQEARTYHSVAILMVDGRVFVGGGGLCDGTPDCVNHFSAEIYSPAYLFDANGDLAQRPVIGTLTGNTLGTGPYNNNPQADYGDVLQVSTDVPVASFSLIRFSAATHSTNNEQRRIPLATTLGTDHSLTIPGRDLLPPGYYMLFAMDANGVPSVARTLRIGTALPLANNPNLVLDMRFDEASGTTVADSSGNGNDGTVLQRDDQGDPVAAVDHSFVDGLFGNAIEFDGKEHTSNSIIDIPYDASFGNITDRFTMSAWVWRDAESGVPERGGRIANVAVLGHDYQDGIGANGIFFGFHNTLYKMSFRTNTGYYDNYAGYAPLAGWNHIVTTYDGSTSKLYANGVLIGEVAASGSVALNGDTGSDLSRFTLSGFYDFRPMPVLPYGNESGITDEVDGRLDEVRIYSSVLGAEEVRQLFEEGLATGEVLSGDCQNSTIVFEYKVGDGPWQTNANNRIVVQEGQEVFLRARNYTEPYFIATQIVDGPTFSSTVDFGADGYQLDTDRPGAANPLGDGLIDTADRGYYTLTTADGCPTTVFVEVTRACDPGDTPIQAEYNINGTWSSGAASITLSEGDRLQLSVLPNNAPFPNASPEVYPISIILPNGNSVGDGFVIDPVTAANAGTYQFVSAQGCTDLLEVVVETTDCAALGLVSEYQVNGGAYISGQASVDVLEGDDLRLSILPNGTAFSVSSTAPNGNSKPSSTTDLFLTDLTQQDAGTYTFTTAGGCSVDLIVNVEVVDCTNINLETEYQLNGAGAYVSGQSQVSVDEGNSITLSILPNGTPFSISSTSANNHQKPMDLSDLTLDNLSAADAGIYTFETNVGCTVTLELLINSIDCAELNLQSQYDLNGSGNFISGAEFVRVPLGESIQLSVVPDVYNGQMLAFEISGPNGITKPLNSQDLIISDVQEIHEGTYIMTSSSGCVAQILVLVGENEVPTAVASSDSSTGTAPLQVSFVGSNSTDDGLITGYSWNFGDGGAASIADPQHTFDTAGEYEVVLTVTDNEGSIATTSLSITVISQNQPPIAVANASPVSGNAPLQVSFNSDASSDDTGIVSYLWDFGNGQTSNQPNPSRTFTELGTFSVTLTVTDAEGLSDEDTIEINVNDLDNQPPVAVASATPTSGINPLTVAFTGSNSTDDTGIASYNWDFGDGESALIADPSHTYTSTGTFTATLTVTDTDGVTDQESLTITVTESSSNQPPVAVATATPLTGTAPLVVDFTGSNSTDDAAITSYLWDFGDGGTATTADAQHTYQQQGAFTATLTVKDAEGETDVESISITVNGPVNQPPLAVISASSQNGIVPLEVNFTGENSTDDVAVATYAWDFGDGNSSSEINPSHIFETPGDFTVSLTVTDAEGLSDVRTINILVLENETNTVGTIIIAPNPANTMIRLYLDEGTTTTANTVSLHDATGKFIAGYILDTIRQGDYFGIPAQILTDGIYYLRITFDNGETEGISFLIRN